MVGSQLKQLKAKFAKNGGGSESQGSNRKGSGSKGEISSFDSKTTRQKQFIHGRNVMGSTGRPGLAKLESQRARVQEYRNAKSLRNRAGILADKRFGESDLSMTEEERSMARFTKERQARKRNFNLEDNDTMEHEYGNSLALDNASEDENFTEELFSRKRSHESDQTDHQIVPERKKSKKEVMEEVIAKSKMHRIERQRKKEELNEMVEQLNDPSEMRELMGELTGLSGGSHEQSHDYDRTLRELAFEKRAKPADRTKTNEELLREQETKAKELEKSRMARMVGSQGADLNEDAESAAREFGFDAVGELRTTEDDYGDLFDGDSSFNDINASSSSAEEIADIDFDQTAKSDLSSFLHNILETQKKYDFGLQAGNKTKMRKFLLSVTDMIICRRWNTEVSVDAFEQVLSCVKSMSTQHDIALVQYFQQRLSNLQSKITNMTSALDQLERADLMAFCLIPYFFSASDHYHTVCTPANLLMCKVLSASNINSRSDVEKGAVLCNVLISAQSISKRYIPEVAGFLQKSLTKLLQSDQLSQPEEYNLNASIIQCSHILNESIDVPSGSMTALALVLNTINYCAEVWRDKSSFAEIFRPLINKLILSKSTPTAATEQAEKLNRLLKNRLVDRKPLLLQAHRPIALASHAPKFEDNYNLDVTYDDDITRKQIKKLQRDMKEEKKAVLKDLRRDAKFLANEEISEKRSEYKKYHESMAKLYSQIQTEEGAEKNKYERERAARKRSSRK